VALVLAVTLAGCSGQSGSRPPQPAPVGPSPQALEPGWTVHTDGRGGFSLALPDYWEHAQRDSPTLTADVAAITARNAELGKYFEASVGSPGNRLEFLAADPRSLGLGFATNAAVFRIDMGNAATAADLAAVTQAKVKALGKDSSISGVIDSKLVRLAGRDAQRLAYVFKSGAKTAAVVSYLLLTDAGQSRIEYELILGSAGTDYAPLFERISSSFRVVAQAAPATASPSG
jgi:hypothetical protein